jgi:hypothetical protein
MMGSGVNLIFSFCICLSVFFNFLIKNIVTGNFDCQLDCMDKSLGDQQSSLLSMFEWYFQG